MDVVEVPGCPEGSLKAVAYIKERQPETVAIKTPDEDCVAVLKIILPLFNYYVIDVYSEGEKYVVKARRGKT
jgi:hypothetical protein